ncbi:LacI family DNA-binding transcriptional regulator [Brachybacterium sp. DNPG3]
MGRPKLKDVAEHAGVSVTTVSRVLNDRGYLSADVRRRVAEAIAALDYRPHEVARSLLGKRTRLVGLVVPSVADPFFGELAAAVEEALAREGYKMLLCDSGDDREREVQYLEMLLAQQVDGILTSTHNDDIPHYRRTDLPVVALDRRLPGGAVPNVRSDNRAGGRLATELLVAEGGRDILHVTATDDASNERMAGYLEVLAENGLAPRILAYGFGIPHAERRGIIERHLEEHRPDAVFASDDISASMVIDWARKNAVAVPESLRVVGYDGTAVVREIGPGLTTVVQPIGEIADVAVRILLDRLDEDSSDGADAAESRTADRVLPVTLHRGRTA